MKTFTKIKSFIQNLKEQRRLYQLYEKRKNARREAERHLKLLTSLKIRKSEDSDLEVIKDWYLDAWIRIHLAEMVIRLNPTPSQIDAFVQMVIDERINFQVRQTIAKELEKVELPSEQLEILGNAFLNGSLELMVQKAVEELLKKKLLGEDKSSRPTNNEYQLEKIKYQQEALEILQITENVDDFIKILRGDGYNYYLKDALKESFDKIELTPVQINSLIEMLRIEKPFCSALDIVAEALPTMCLDESQVDKLIDIIMNNDGDDQLRINIIKALAKIRLTEKQNNRLFQIFDKGEIYSGAYQLRSYKGDGLWHNVGRTLLKIEYFDRKDIKYLANELKNTKPRGIKILYGQMLHNIAVRNKIPLQINS